MNNFNVKDFSDLPLSENDLGFLSRVYATDENIYLNRLKSISFSDKEVVLDAACGFGQWAFSMAKLNRKVHAFDFSKERIDTCKKIHKKYKKSFDITFKVASLEHTGYEDNTFDSIFCYSAIFFVDYKKALLELQRILKPGGKLYFCANSWGWYIYNILKQPNKTKDFSPRKNAIETFKETFKYEFLSKRNNGQQIIMPTSKIEKILSEMGFDNILIAGDGKINLDNINNVKSFYPEKKYGFDNVYEVLCQKKSHEAKILNDSNISITKTNLSNLSLTTCFSTLNSDFYSLLSI